MDFPKLRSDLTVVSQPTPEGTASILRDPLTGRFFRLGAVERCIVAHCDGATPLATVCARVAAELDGELPRESLERFLAALDAAGLLDTGRARGPAAPRRRWRVRGRLLCLRIPLADPDRLLARLAPAVAPCFTPAFALLASVLILAGTLIVAANLGVLRDEVVQAYRPAILPALLLTVWSVVALHELAHGLACKWLGGEVHEMGFLLLYFQPAAYCDVSEAWLFPDKWRRVLVTLAGPACELCVWAASVLAWRVTDPASGLHEVAFLIVATSGIKTLFNLNPLLKLDGYYLMSDLTDMPNLRRRSFREIGERLRRWLGQAVPDAAALTPRERRLCLGYGAIAAVFSVAFLGYAVAKLGRYLAHGRTLAFLLCLGLLSVKLPRRVRRFFPGASGAQGTDDDDDWDAGDDAPTARTLEPVPRAGDPHADAAVPAAPPRRLFRVLPWLAGTLLAATLPLLARVELRVPGPFVALPAQSALVRAQTDGLVDQVCVSEAQPVRAGDVLVRLSARDTEGELRATQAELEQARARLAMLAAGPTEAEIAVAAATESTAAAHLPFTRTRRDMDLELYQIGILSKKEAGVSEEAAVVAERVVAEAASRLAELRQGTRPELLRAARAEVAGLDAKRALLAEKLSLLTLRSPASGIVATPELKLRSLPGQQVRSGDLLVEIHDDRRVAAEIAVSERDIADIRVGQEVDLKARADPGTTFHGRVIAVGVVARGGASPGGEPESGAVPAASASAVPRTLVVTTEVDNPALALRAQMTGQARIACGRRRLAELLGRWLVRTLNLEFGPWS